MNKKLLQNKINNLWFGISDKIRFVIVGGFNARVSFVIFSLICLIWGEKFYQISLALSWFLSSFVSFATQKFLVFNIEGNITKQYCKCCTTWFFSYLINAFFLELLVKKLYLNVYLSQIIATVICAIFTYICLKLFAFRRGS